MNLALVADPSKWYRSPMTIGVAMAVSMGPKEPLDYSVFSAAGAGLLLAVRVQHGGRRAA